MAIIKGTNGKDHLTSGPGADLVKGLNGNDVLVANGDDTLDGGRGNDTYRVFEGGAYEIVDAGGIDTIETRETDVLLAAGIENLTMYQGGDWYLSTALGNGLDNTIIVVGDGSSRVDGAGGKDTLKGGDGSDTINGGGNADNLHGGEGNDVLVIDSRDWHVDGDGGTDVLAPTPKYFDLTRMPHERIEEFEVIDLSYSAFANVLTVDRDSLKWLSFNTDRVKVILGSGDRVQIKGDYREYGDDSDGVQQYALGRVRLSVYGSDIKGTSGNDVLAGNEWANVVRGFEGDDTLTGGLGIDTLIGGSGNDVYVVDDLGAGTRNWEEDVLSDSGGTDTLISIRPEITLAGGIEKLVISSSGNTQFATGNNLANLIVNEQSGRTRIDGADGDDTLIGGAGSDDFTFRAGSGNYGNDLVDGGGGTVDWIVTGWRSAVVIDFRDGTVTGGGKSGSGSVRFTDIEGAAGGSFDDLLIADDAGRRLFGGTGDDTLLGGAGDDVLMSDSHPHFGTVGEAPRPNGYDLIDAGGGDDRIFSDGGNDTIDGGTGNDTIDGGIGSDILLGGDGDDLVTWSADDIRVSGDGGEDTLVCSGDLDLTALANNLIQEIEIIECNSSKLTLGSADILDLSSTTDTLKILGNKRSAVDIVGSFVDEGVQDGFHRYQVGAATLLVDTAITDVS